MVPGIPNIPCCIGPCSSNHLGDGKFFLLGSVALRHLTGLQRLALRSVSHILPPSRPVSFTLFQEHSPAIAPLILGLTSLIGCCQCIKSRNDLNSDMLSRMHSTNRLGDMSCEVLCSSLSCLQQLKRLDLRCVEMNRSKQPLLLLRCAYQVFAAATT